MSIRSIPMTDAVKLVLKKILFYRYKNDYKIIVLKKISH
jgi:hypothetical protein